MTQGINKTLVSLIGGHLFLHGCMTGMRMAAPLLALRQGHSPAAVGVLLALFALTQVFFALPAGRYADRHGLKRPMAISAVVGVLGAGLAAAFPTFPMLCLGALLTGGAAGIGTIAVQRHAGRAAHGATELKQVFSWLSIGPAISNFVGPFFAGLVIDYAGFPAAFLMLALFPIVSWFWVWRTPDLPPLVRNDGDRATGGWNLLREPMFRRLLIVNWLLSSCWDVHTFVVPVLGHERGFSASVIGTILGAFAVAATLIRIALPLMAAYVREWAAVAGAMVATTVLFAIYPLLHSPIMMGVCSVLLGFALGVVQPMLMSKLHQITPEAHHGEAIAMRVMAINVSSVTMPILFGAFGAVVGVSGVFWITGIAVAIGTRQAFQLKGDKSP